ncbi:MAG: hypothetical protein M1482_13850 [Chloroflexi bacterium]|nr:hypothetical protein [Chloroflexota bacterium]
MSQRSAFLTVGAVVGCGLLLFCLGIAAAFGYTRFAPSGSSAVNRIAYADNSNNIQVVDPTGGNRVALTTDGAATEPVYLFPTWSPDGRRVAFVGVTGAADTRQVVLYAAVASGTGRASVFKSATDIPFYLYWAPDSQWIGFLTQSGNDMALMLGRVDGQGQARKLDSGSPFYWAWSPDSRQLLMHIGGSARDSQDARLALAMRDGGVAAHALKSMPADFQAPQYSPDGTLVLYAATSGDGQDALYAADAQGGNARSIVTYQGNIAFAWSPNGKQIASIVTAGDVGLPNYGPVWVSDADGSNRQKVTDDGVLAFYWSPDSRQIAFLTVAPGNQGQSCLGGCRSGALAAPRPQSQQLELNWQILDVASKKARSLVSFSPTGDFLSLLPYFDQYARSLTFWSPDSNQLVYAQDEGDNTGSIWVADVSGKAAPLRVGDGTVAVWSWH